MAKSIVLGGYWGLGGGGGGLRDLGVGVKGDLEMGAD